MASCTMRIVIAILMQETTLHTQNKGPNVGCNNMSKDHVSLPGALGGGWERQ